MASVLGLCIALALLPAAAAAQDVAGDCSQYTNRSCEECLKNVTAQVSEQSVSYLERNPSLCKGFQVMSRPDKEDERMAREREKRRVRQEERRAEMKSRHDEIRRKYGLFKEENPYAKFEN
ncbi:pituitary tumor-transforming protein 1 protein-interacting protein [Amazona aestiva]|uniref:Pituitary tumor-transforming protein 1 protein-interacting protein n=1 Tax=Amazona aestiva TaxID=12930 RepID=A0A0Q3TG58_AMAAE|nr:pituitary tumor-transforming protein 1 protein-interacting protein [Amazona aestiva]